MTKLNKLKIILSLVKRMRLNNLLNIKKMEKLSKIYYNDIEK